MSFSALLLAGMDDSDIETFSALPQSAMQAESPDFLSSHGSQFGFSVGMDTSSNSSCSSPSSSHVFDSPHNSSQHLPSQHAMSHMYRRDLQHDNEQLKMRNLVLETENEAIKYVFICLVICLQYVLRCDQECHELAYECYSTSSQEWCPWYQLAPGCS